MKPSDLAARHVVTLANLAERWALEAKRLRARADGYAALTAAVARRDAYFNALAEADRLLTALLSRGL